MGECKRGACLTGKFEVVRGASTAGLYHISVNRPARDESERTFTEQNLLHAGYSNWERLILRGPSDAGKPATTYKSEKRKELEDEGYTYTIHGSSGDQRSDLLGFAAAKRSFKLPNPMYYIA